MSLDDQFRELNHFRQSLQTFNQILEDAMRTLSKQYDDVLPHWKDNWHEVYQKSWEPLQESMDQYLRREAPNYLAFLDSKIEYLAEYLHG